MGSFLDLVRDVAALSGTADRRTIESLPLTGRTALIASLVRDAWLEIQNQQRAWRFLLAEFPDTAILLTNAGAYTAQTLNLPQWSNWIVSGADGRIPMTTWPVDDRGDESELQFESYPVFRRLRQTGADALATRGQPQTASVDLQDRLVVWPIPDRDYRISGSYRRAAQRLENEADVPIVAEEHHPAIVWAATVLLHRHDEADQAVIFHTERGLADRMAALRRRYVAAAGLRYEPLGGYSRPGYPFSFDVL